MICVRVRCCILTIGSSETILVLFIKKNLKISALCELSPKATSPAKKAANEMSLSSTGLHGLCPRSLLHIDHWVI